MGSLQPAWPGSWILIPGRAPGRSRGQFPGGSEDGCLLYSPGRQGRVYILQGINTGTHTTLLQCQLANSSPRSRRRSANCPLQHRKRAADTVHGAVVVVEILQARLGLMKGAANFAHARADWPLKPRGGSPSGFAWSVQRFNTLHSSPFTTLIPGPHPHRPWPMAPRAPVSKGHRVWAFDAILEATLRAPNPPPPAVRHCTVWSSL